LSEPNAVGAGDVLQDESFQLQTGRPLKPTHKRVLLNVNTSIFSRSMSIFPGLIHARCVAWHPWSVRL